MRSHSPCFNDKRYGYDGTDELTAGKNSRRVDPARARSSYDWKPEEEP